MTLSRVTYSLGLIVAYCLGKGQGYREAEEWCNRWCPAWRRTSE